MGRLWKPVVRFQGAVGGATRPSRSSFLHAMVELREGARDLPLGGTLTAAEEWHVERRVGYRPTSFTHGG